MAWFRRVCTFPNAVACVCLFVVLGGVSVAQEVSTTAKKLVTGKQVKDRSLAARDVKKGSLTGKEIKDRSLTPADFKGSVVGPKGDPGPPGPVGQIQGAPAGGDLAGTYPDPTIGAGKVDSAKIADGSVEAGDLKLPLALTSTAGGSEPLFKSFVDTTTGTRPAIYGEVNSQFANFGTAGVWGVSSGTGGFAGLFHAKNPAGNGPALIAIADGNGNGLTANADNTGDGVETTADGTGTALYAWTPSFGDGRAARAVNFNTANVNPVLTVEQHSAGSIAVFKNGNPGTVNRARIDATGKGFFNGGTQTGGADLAEIVPTCGGTPRAGQVVEIDPERPDCFRLSTSANSTRVAGVISSAPGMTLNAPNGAEKEATGPALALAGRVPVKVTAERRAIRIGDLLVASPTAGYAMRAPADPAVGTVIGKALENLDQAKGTIKMLVMNR